MKNIILNGQTYSGISEVSLPVSGGTALFKDKDEIVEPTGSVSITANGTYDVTDKASAVVNVPAPEINLQNKTATANGEVTADEGYDGLGVVTVAVSGDVPTLITKSITANGTYNASTDSADGYSSVTVNVPAPVLPTLTNPASASDILSGKEAIDGNGAKLTGTCTYDADTSDADAVASDIAEGKTAYVNGQKVTGTNTGGGGVNPLLYASNNCQKLFYEQTLPNNFAVEFGENVTLLSAGSTGACFGDTKPQSAENPSELSVKCNGVVTSLQYTFNKCKFKKITLNFDTSHVTNWGHTFDATVNLEEIGGIIDMSAATSTSSCFGNMHATTVRFAPNTIPLSLDFRYSSYMSKESVISLANGLNESVTGQSLSTFASNYAAKLTTLGSVTMDESNTYHIFTEDADGDTTLQNFITNVKGWAIT